MKKLSQKLEVWRKKSVTDLQKDIQALEDELIKMVVAISLQQNKDVSGVHKLKKDIARLRTVLGENKS